jgi:hypothetical protein
MIAAAVVGAAGVFALASVSYGFFTVGGSGTGSAQLAGVQDLTVSAAAPTGSALDPGGSADLAAEVVNPNPAPVHVHAFVLDLSPVHPAGIVSNHDGCPATSVTFNGPISNGGADFVFPPGTSSLVLHDALSMSRSAEQACQGATFGVYLQADGE